MKNKGFTLVEVMAIVIIIAAIALVSFPVLTNVMKNNEKLEEDTFKENAIEAAKTYCNLNKSYDEEGICSVDISKLIEESYLDKPTDEKYEYDNKLVTCDKGYQCNYVKLKQYVIGEEVTIQSEKYNVIGQGSDYVTLLKHQPLTVNEVNTYGGSGTENNHVNKYTLYSRGTAYDWGDTNHSGGMAYYSSSTCGYIGDSLITSGCTISYEDSEVKYVVDAWAEDKFTNELKEVDGYSARLVKFADLQQFYPSCRQTASYCYKARTTPSWLYNWRYVYWTMSQLEGSSVILWHVSTNGNLEYLGSGVFGYSCAVRPVINVYKSKLS